MKQLTTLSLLFVLCACTSSPKESRLDQAESVDTIRDYPELQALMDSMGVHGAVLVYDLRQDTYAGFNPDRWSKGYLPASTFKIPNSLIGLETGVLSGPEMIFEWDGQKRQLAIWEKDMSLKDAFHDSCVPCYQEVARKIGPDRMNEYLQLFEYGNMDVHAENIDLFWLQGKSRITQYQQIEFLTKLYQESLPLSAQTMQTFKNMMVREETEDYRLSGKTGWAIREGFNIGWFVGYLEKGEETYLFATNIEPNDPNHMEAFAQARVELSMRMLEWMDVLP